MIRHVVMWKLKEDLTPFEREQLMLEFKLNMSNLGPIVEGIVKIEVIVDILDSSNMDMLLISEFESKDALNQYQNHPKHKDATKCLKGMAKIRSCVDYVL
ncbi:heme-degrading monooxygenase HmoA [Breznakia sp. PF5-3]|uniref:Dabb family protein n=1 Tax=unclassified Breznakia TaxID=2623764 RepID=UPI0024067D89|nr:MULTISPECIES: Dabb family protein [unclassified Breznakia]MDF9824798.1 heme-degrading monooxygenase HmoA [Breznakia sp. PM6-1]MDF9835746.1 heme-degrading monooxygenase HmoA [Breznakia sp. PF5-3]MDF9837832.1 heme-degrading monooxygenase HmoA [Breznakia sp. PFB2-8]MDF9859797.1 heme-degrading monooxygenase HmoA [Breznakia sp. PH5-24]